MGDNDSKFFNARPVLDTLSTKLDPSDLTALRLVSRGAEDAVVSTPGFPKEVRHVVDERFLRQWASSGLPPFLYTPKHLHINLHLEGERPSWAPSMEGGLAAWTSELRDLETLKISIVGTAGEATPQLLHKLLGNVGSVELIASCRTLTHLIGIQELGGFLRRQERVRIEQGSGVFFGLKTFNPLLAPLSGLQSLSLPVPSLGNRYAVVRPAAIQPIAENLRELEVLSCRTLGLRATRDQVRELRNYLEQLIIQLGGGLASIEALSIAFPYDPSQCSSRFGDEPRAEFLFHTFLAEHALPSLWKIHFELEVFTPRWFCLIDTCSQRESPISELSVVCGTFFAGFECWDKEDLAGLSDLRLTKFRLVQNRWIRRGYLGNRAGAVPLLQGILVHLPPTIKDLWVELVNDPPFGAGTAGGFGGAWLECKEIIRDEWRLPWAAGIERIVLKGFDAVLDLDLLRRLLNGTAALPSLRHLEIEQKVDVRAETLKILFGDETRLADSLLPREPVVATLRRNSGDREGIFFKLSLS